MAGGAAVVDVVVVVVASVVVAGGAVMAEPLAVAVTAAVGVMWRDAPVGDGELVTDKL